MIPTDVVQASSAQNVSGVSGVNFHPRIAGTGISRLGVNSYGTIGFKAYKKMIDGTLEWYLVSCYHVIFDPELHSGLLTINSAVNSPDLICPCLTDGGLPAHKIADATEGILNNEIDVGLGKLSTGASLRDEILNLGKPDGAYAPTHDDVKVNFEVFMNGRVSGYQAGKLVSINSRPTIPYGNNNITMRELYRATLQVAKGDSGSAVLDKKNRIIGIVTGKDSTGAYIIPVVKCLMKYSLNI